VAVERVVERESSLVAFGARGGQPVVLKVLKKPGDEWRSAKVLAAFDGCGVARMYEYCDGALLLEHLSPGHSLASLTLNGKDSEATEVLAGLIQTMSGCEPPSGCPTVEDWGKGFSRYLAAGHTQIPTELVEEAFRHYSGLCTSQRRPQLLHGDLQHYNILFDSSRGWLAIDPKGVVGEREYEVGAFLRNPVEAPASFGSRAIVERRVNQLGATLTLDLSRALAWGFAQAVLSAIWSVEDGQEVDASHPALRLANAIRPMLSAHCRWLESR